MRDDDTARFEDRANRTIRRQFTERGATRIGLDELTITAEEW